MAAGVAYRPTPDTMPAAASVLSTPEMARMSPAQRAQLMKKRKKGTPQLEAPDPMQATSVLS